MIWGGNVPRLYWNTIKQLWQNEQDWTEFNMRDAKDAEWIPTFEGLDKEYLFALGVSTNDNR